MQLAWIIDYLGIIRYVVSRISVFLWKLHLITFHRVRKTLFSRLLIHTHQPHLSAFIGVSDAICFAAVWKVLKSLIKAALQLYWPWKVSYVGMTVWPCSSVSPPFQSWASLHLRNTSQRNKSKWETQDISATCHPLRKATVTESVC